MNNWEALYIAADELAPSVGALVAAKDVMLENAAECEERASVLHAEAEALEEQAERLRNRADVIALNGRWLQSLIDAQKRAEQEQESLAAVTPAPWVAELYGD